MSVAYLYIRMILYRIDGWTSGGVFRYIIILHIDIIHHIVKKRVDATGCTIGFHRTFTFCVVKVLQYVFVLSHDQPKSEFSFISEQIRGTARNTSNSY